MAPPGARGKPSLDFWMLAEDVADFDHVLRESTGGSQWHCSQPGPVGLHETHLHGDLPAALHCGGQVQAFLPLPGSGDHVAEVQFLNSRLADHDAIGEHLRAGRLAVRWFLDEVGPAGHVALTEQASAVWSAFRRATRPCTLGRTRRTASSVHVRPGRSRRA